MFERFTDRSRRVLVLAQEEARLLSHGFIGTEHILLGLIHEGDGLAAKVLESLDISLQSVREKVEDTIGPARSALTGSPPFTPRAKKVLELALREALRLGHSFIGTEHILLGLVGEGEGVAAQVLQALGADLVGVREKVLELLSGHEARDAARAERVGESVATGVPFGADEVRYPYKVLSGPESSIDAAPLGLRVLGALLFEDRVNVLWRLQGIPDAVTRLVENASGPPGNARVPPRPRPRAGTRQLFDRCVRAKSNPSS